MTADASSARPARHRFEGRLSIAGLAIAALAVLGCASPRNIREPVDGAVVVTFPDSAGPIYNATIAAINDEPIRMVLTDRDRGVIETEYFDLTSVRLSVNMTDYPQADRMVKLRFRTRNTLGATNLIAEAIRRPASGGAAMERMLAPAHPAHQVLRRILAGVDERLSEQRSR